MSVSDEARRKIEGMQRGDDLPADVQKRWHRLRELRNGNLDAEALVYLERIARLQAMRQMEPKSSGLKYILKEEEHLAAEYEKQIVAAARKLNADFLDALASAIKHVKSANGKLPMIRPQTATVLLAWLLLKDFAEDRGDGRPPTARRLLEYIATIDPGLNIDIRTVRFICAEEKLPLTRDRAGRRAKEIRKSR